MEMKSVYFLRHAEIKKEIKCDNELQIGLTDDGIKQANSLVLDCDYFDCIFSSPYERCKMTIEEIKNIKHKDFIVDKRLVMIQKNKKEFDQYKIENKKYTYEYMFSHKKEKIVGMENVDDVELRLVSFLNQYLNKYNSMLICTHASFITALYSKWTNEPCANKFIEIGNKYCYLLKTEFCSVDNEWVLNSYCEL